MYNEETYWNWKTEPDEYEEPLSEELENANYAIKQAGEFFSHMVDMITGKAPFNEGDMYNCIEEISSYLNVKYEGAELAITDKPKVPEYLARWMEFNNNYLKGER